MCGAHCGRRHLQTAQALLIGTKYDQFHVLPEAEKRETVAHVRSDAWCARRASGPRRTPLTEVSAGGGGQRKVCARFRPGVLHEPCVRRSSSARRRS